MRHDPSQILNFVTSWRIRRFKNWLKAILLIVGQQIDRQTDRQIDRQSDRQIDRQTDREIDRQKDRQIDRYTDRQIDRQTDRQIDRQTDRQIHRQTDRQIDRQTDRHIDRQTDKIFKIIFLQDSLMHAHYRVMSEFKNFLTELWRYPFLL